MWRSIVVTWLLGAVTAHAQSPSTPSGSSETPPPAIVETVDVVAVTPLHGSGLPRLHIPSRQEEAKKKLAHLLEMEVANA